MREEALKRSAAVALVIVFGLAAAGCRSADPPLESQPDLRGTIVEIHPASSQERVSELLIESDPSPTPEAGAGLYLVSVSSSTILLEPHGAQVSLQEAAFHAGQRVQVWFAGPVRESYPMQVDAGRIRLLE